MRNLKGVDIGRIVFACLIPILHISIPNNTLIDVIRQYIARLGVPFFYAVSGMFLIYSLEQKGRYLAWITYSKRIGRILIIWLLIYLPILIYEKGIDLQLLVFKTPAYLWYLTGLLVASIPFCIWKNRDQLLVVSLVLYLIGTLYGDSYKWLIGGCPQYESEF